MIGPVRGTSSINVEFTAKRDAVSPVTAIVPSGNETGHGEHDNQRSRDRAPQTQADLESLAVAHGNKTVVPMNVYKALEKTPGFDPDQYLIG
jgi:hypothetical protein